MDLLLRKVQPLWCLGKVLQTQATIEHEGVFEDVMVSSSPLVEGDIANLDEISACWVKATEPDESQT